jgi:modulator of FtsH protease HflK
MDIRYPNEGMPKLPPYRFGPIIIPVFILIFFLLSTGSIFYQIEADEVGVIQYFGKYSRTTQPGLHMKLPLGIETVQKIRVTHIFKEEFGFRTVNAGVRSIFTGGDDDYSNKVRLNREYRTDGSDPLLDESLMLTGDLNVAIVEWIVQYKIKDPVEYAFQIRNPQETLRNMSEAIMRLVIGDHTINEVLTAGREAIQTEVLKKLQEVLDSYKSGMLITNVILQDVTPPDPVKPSFNEVNEARQEKEKMINQAHEEYNRVIPKAKGQAEQVIREAEGYAIERTNRAKGDAERFDLQLDSYRKAPDVTRQRLYLETIQEVYPLLKDKIIIDASQKGMLPLLNLNPKDEVKEP